MVKSRVVLKNCPECARDISEGIASRPCNNIDCVNNVIHNRQSGSRAGKSTDKGKVKRKRLQNGKSNNDGNLTEKKMDKDPQSRPKVVSQERPQRRSPRNTIEAREARAMSRALRSKELFNVGKDICGELSKEKQALAALFLTEINRKLRSAVWKQ